MTAVTDLTERLASVPLLAGLDRDDLERICSGANEITLEPGAQLFAEGDHGEHAYVITAGEVEIRKTSLGRQIVLAVLSEGDVIGEMALLQEEPRNATAVARTTTELARIPKTALDELLATSATASRSMFNVLLDRWRDTQSQLRQSERMAQLGTLTAGLAHELNNPSAAVQRAAQQLRDAITRVEELQRTDSLSEQARRLLAALLAEAPEPQPLLSALERSDREEALIEWLEDAGVEDGWELAPVLVDLGVNPDELRSANDGVSSPELARVLEVVRASREVRSLLGEVAEGTTRSCQRSRRSAPS
jgi:CRP-like cAMP-binding protein